MKRWMASLAAVASLTVVGGALAPVHAGVVDRAPPDIGGVSIGSVDRHVVRGRVDCEGVGTIQIKVDVNQPSSGFEHARGHGEVTVPCEKQVYRVPLSERSGRYRNGKARVRVVAQASAGPPRDRVVVRDKRPIDGERWYTEVDTPFADGVRARIKRVAQRGETLHVKVHVVCPEPTVVGVGVRVTQFVPDGVIEGTGSAVAGAECDGPADIGVAVAAATGTLRPGRANVDVHVDAVTSAGQALAIAPATLTRSMRLPVFSEPTDPKGPIRITALSTEGYGYEVRCDEGGTYSTRVALHQQQRRRVVVLESAALGGCGDDIEHRRTGPLRPGRVVIEAETVTAGHVHHQVIRQRVK